MRMQLRLMNSSNCELDKIDIPNTGEHCTAREYMPALLDAAWVLADGDRIEVTTT